jgi:hypothetical protein
VCKVTYDAGRKSYDLIADSSGILFFCPMVKLGMLKFLSDVVLYVLVRQRKNSFERKFAENILSVD